MKFKELVEKARTCRVFCQEEIPAKDLDDLIDMARITPSARNAQILRYVIAQDKNFRAKLEESFVLGGALPPEQKPQRGKDSPAAVIVFLAPQEITQFGIMDIGIAAQTIQLGATEKGYAACIIGAFKKELVADILQKEGVSFFDEESGAKLLPYLLMIVGKPNQEREITAVPKDGKTTYYHDELGCHMVPKRALKDILLLHK